MEENRSLNPEVAQDTTVQSSICVSVREQMQDFMEGFLDTLTEEAVRAHIAVCFLCARNLDELKRTIRLVESLPFIDMRANFAPRIMEAIEARQQRNPRRPWWDLRPPEG